MATMTKKSRSAMQNKELEKRSLSVSHIAIDGKSYVVIPTDDFEEMMIDNMLGIITEERRNENEGTFLPLGEVKAKHAALRKGKKNA